MYKLNGNLLKKMALSGAANLKNNQKRIDALNVFPVPDGDTGTNMSMTFSIGAKNASEVYSDNLNDVARALSKGLLMGARGNSGVITSQIFRGFYQHLENDYEADVMKVAEAFVNGNKVAYKAIMKPVEGTILTVIREGAEESYKYLLQNPKIDLCQYFEKLLECMEISLNNTPNLLPILKEVGVVDSGGSGIVEIIKGMLESLKGNDIPLNDEEKEISHSVALDVENQEFGYCTEFIIELNDEFKEKFKEEKLKKSLSGIGDSLVVVRDDDLVKVHVHTLKPGDALNIGQRYGEFIKLKIENMQQQHNNIKETQTKKTKYGIISVAAGEGLIKLFKDNGSDIVVSGGQTMNPSTNDFVSAINKLNAENIIILPNNSNIILAAKQAKDLLNELNIYVLETKSIQEGLSALSVFSKENDIDDNLALMNETYQNIITGSITYAIKDTTFYGIEVKEGDFIALGSKKIISSNKDRFVVIKDLIDEMIKNEEKEIFTIYVGENTDIEEVKQIENYLNENTEFEVEVIESNQPVYLYFFSLE